MTKPEDHDVDLYAVYRDRTDSELSRMVVAAVGGYARPDGPRLVGALVERVQLRERADLARIREGLRRWADELEAHADNEGSIHPALDRYHRDRLLAEQLRRFAGQP